MNKVWLTNYLMHNPKQELVNMLVGIYIDGIVPYIPQDNPPLKTRGGKGRPNKEVMQQRKNFLRSLLIKYYPESISLRVITEQTGLNMQTILKLQNDPEFLRTLPAYLQEYFYSFNTPNQYNSISPLWRAVLDIHYYDLVLKNPEMHLPLYESHLAMWLPMVKPPQLRSVNVRNYIEYNRIRSLPLADKGYDIPLQPTSEFDARDADYPCNSGCSICIAHHNKVQLNTVEDARTLLNVSFNWQPVKNIPLVGGTAARYAELIL
jgi:hypothetical protein